MSQPTAVFELEINDFILSVTTRFYPGDNLQLLDDLTANTISAWLWIVGLLEKNEWDTSVAIDSVEEKYAKANNLPYEPPLGDARVTVWATWRSNNKFKFHLNSDDKPQDAVLANTAARAGIQKATDRWLEKHPQSTKAGSNSSATPPQATTTAKAPENAPKAAYNAQHGYSPEDAQADVMVQGKLFTKKDAIAKLSPGSPFKWRVAQIEKHSKDGKDFYEFFEFWGGKAGQYSGSSVFTDNEIAINSGLIAYLDSLGIKAGQALTGDWITNATVGKPKTKTVKGEEKTFTNIYVNSFEGQPEKVN